jgi:aspartate-semialdehyde dehydrogenase
MNVVIFGATGMVGQAVLWTCLQDPAVERIVLVLRTAVPDTDSRIVQIVHRDFHDFASPAGDLAGLDACLFCLGVTSAGKQESEYRRVTYDITRSKTRLYAVAYRTLGRLYPVLARVAPNHVITSEELGRAMLAIAVRRPDQRIFDTAAMKAFIAPDRPTG